MQHGLLANFLELDTAALAVRHGIAFDQVTSKAIDLNSLGVATELACLAQTEKHWSQYSKKNLPELFASSLRKAHHTRLQTFSGEANGRVAGFMCLDDVDPERFKPALLEFDTVARTAMRFKKNIGKSRGLVCGAIGEMVDNVFEHSEAPRSGIVGFMGADTHIEISVADAGIGVFESLRKNPAFAYLSDAGMALSLAVRDGTSRYSTTLDGAGRGHGFSTLFRGLNSLDAEIRIRSDDYSLEVGGKAINERAPTISQKAYLRGLVVTFRIYF